MPPKTSKVVSPRGLPVITKPWYDTNPIYLEFINLERRVDEAIAGEDHARLVIICGPPGIAKSERIGAKLFHYSERLRKIWNAQKVKDERRTTANPDSGEAEFRPAFVPVTGRIPAVQMHCRMFWASQRNEILFVDDVGSLRDKKIQELMQMASDNAKRYMVEYNYHSDNLPDPRVPTKYQMRGSTICVNNFNRKQGGEDKLLELFEKQVLDRACQLHFTFERQPLFEYVWRMAFQDDPKQGLLRYVLAPRAKDSPDGTSTGCGWSIDQLPEAKKLLVEVKEYFFANVGRCPSISFRVLRRITYDRFCNPNEWISLADGHLNPRSTTEVQNQGGRPPAFVERPG